MPRIRRTSDAKWWFYCPGCQEAHAVNDTWGFNGDRERPTFTPSILVTGVERMTDDEYDRIMNGEKIQPRPRRCHSFVSDGQIAFLHDCTHELAGTTVDLPDCSEAFTLKEQSLYNFES